ncbi:NAD(P)H dehydrogenase (quinone) [Sphingopyxis fribergensis]|uniref:FMN dependent NADH:quinone oxidoreductase n=1 Tax=Sphingopyxis fribergensis TaxID=1515612 RepID=A0A0A7PNM3_9SPHN|nr:NAD(P)H-dependent oxidoreductase [Sphingopyxis fribergensis]AJA09522.1 NAD(P)H dehydrogenase (quinone) [Sphingopyxis fribergensis]
MSKLLVIEVSPRFEFSVSRALAARFVENWKAAHPQGEVVSRDLATMNLPFVDLPWIGGAFSPPEQHTEEHLDAISLSNELIAELQSASDIVIATPMYNFTVPAVLKAYVDQIIRPGVTVSATYEGLVTGKTATVIVVTGGDFRPGAPFAAANAVGPYLQQALGFIGITDLDIVLACRTRMVDEGEVTITEFIVEHEEMIAAAAVRSFSPVAA